MSWKDIRQPEKKKINLNIQGAQKLQRGTYPWADQLKGQVYN
jgi:hypothetical protein